jgi:CelD/BcsL family acetyltransferase involved in cellulose biosynthesis
VHGTIESLFRVEWRPLAELSPIAAEWRALAGRALEPNVFYEPAFALAAQPVFGRDVGAGLVWSRASEPRLLGFFPARIERRRYGVPLPVLVGWTHPYGPFGAPLVDRDRAEAVIAAWFDHLANDPRLPNMLLIPYLPLDGPFAHALDAVVARRHGRSVSFARHARALLAPASGARDDYLARAIGPKKRGELRRLRRRLGDSGVVMSSSVGEAAAMTRALDDFLAIEASGWKGRAGTAARSDADVRKFMQAAVLALAGEGKARIDRLLVDARAIAAIVMLKSGPAVWGWKIAYDESFARFSPGVQVLVDVTERLLEDATVARADSCATPDHPMIDHIWRERHVLADRLIRIGPDKAATFALACALEAALRAAIAGAKRLRDLLRRK